MQYAGFWRRLFAVVLDVIILLPILLLSFWGSEEFRLWPLYNFLPGIIFGLWFYVYLVKRYGGTPGKLLMKIKIVKLDGSNVGYKEAALRESVLLFLSAALSAAWIPIVLSMTDAEYFALSWQDRGLYMLNHAPGWYVVTDVAMNIWIASEFVVMLTNNKRRALHDFMAGTVVIFKESLNKSRQNDSGEAAASA